MARRSLWLILLTGIFGSYPAWPYFQLEMMKQKRAKIESSQWTLADWLAQKKRVALMDHWLAMNRSATVMELILSGAYQDEKLKVTDELTGTTGTSEITSQIYKADIYLTLFNFFGEFEAADNRRESFGGGAGLRIFGTSAQTTNWVVRYGWRKRNHFADREVWENQFVESSIQLYLFRFLGLNGEYRHYFAQKSNLGAELSGHRATTGLFIESGFLRIFGEYFREPLAFKQSGLTTSSEEREGFGIGAKFFF